MSALALVGNIADWFDEPFADSSQLPTYLVSRMTRQHVTVALSGDGGDELFGGYPKYATLAKTWRRVGHLPRGVRALLGRALNAMPERALTAAAARTLDAGRAERIGEKTRRLAAALAAGDADAAAAAIDVVGADHSGLVPGAADRCTHTACPALPQSLPDLVSRMQAQDMAGYLPDDILTKVDRCSMAVSLESREPLLDHRVVEFIWSLPALAAPRPRTEGAAEIGAGALSAAGHGRPAQARIFRAARPVADRTVARLGRGLAIAAQTGQGRPARRWRGADAVATSSVKSRAERNRALEYSHVTGMVGAVAQTVMRRAQRDTRPAAAPARLLYLVSEDWYFLSHRLPMARAAREAGYEVHVATRVVDGGAAIAQEGFTLHPLNWRRGSTNPIDFIGAVRRSARRLSRARHPTSCIRWRSGPRSSDRSPHSASA